MKAPHLLSVLALTLLLAACSGLPGTGTRVDLPGGAFSVLVPSGYTQTDEVPNNLHQGDKLPREVLLFTDGQEPAAYIALAAVDGGREAGLTGLNCALMQGMMNSVFKLGGEQLLAQTVAGLEAAGPIELDDKTAGLYMDITRENLQQSVYQEVDMPEAVCQNLWCLDGTLYMAVVIAPANSLADAARVSKGLRESIQREE